MAATAMGTMDEAQRARDLAAGFTTWSDRLLDSMSRVGGPLERKAALDELDARRDLRAARDARLGLAVQA